MCSKLTENSWPLLFNSLSDCNTAIRNKTIAPGAIVIVQGPKKPTHGLTETQMVALVRKLGTDLIDAAEEEFQERRVKFLNSLTDGMEVLEHTDDPTNGCRKRMRFLGGTFNERSARAFNLVFNTIQETSSSLSTALESRSDNASLEKNLTQIVTGYLSDDLNVSFTNDEAVLFFLRALVIYPNNLKNGEFDKEAPQEFCLERVTIAQRQGASANKVPKEKLTTSKTNSSACLGIEIDETPQVKQLTSHLTLNGPIDLHVETLDLSNHKLFIHRGNGFDGIINAVHMVLKAFFPSLKTLRWPQKIYQFYTEDSGISLTYSQELFVHRLKAEHPTIEVIPADIPGKIETVVSLS